MKARFIFILTLAGFLIYFNSLFNSFVWDDEEQIITNTPVRSLGNLPNFFKGSTFNTGGSGGLGGLYYKPLMTTGFSLLYTLFGQNAPFFHLFQIILHIANTVLVFLIFNHFFGKQIFAFILSLIFLIHPQNNEAVVYISALQDPLFFFFGSLALYLAIKKDLDISRGIFVFLLLLFSLLSKETGAVFLLIIGVFLLLYKKSEALKYFLIALGTLGVYLFLRLGVAGIYFTKHGLSPISIISLEERLISLPKIIFTYFINFIYPKNLAISQHWVVKSQNFPDFFLPLLALSFLLVFLIILGIILFRRDYQNFLIFLFFLSWFILGLGVHLQIFPLDLTYSDRWFYFPIVGLLGIIGTGVSKLKVKSLKLRVIFFCLVFLAILGLSFRTIIRNTNWKDGLTLYSHDIKISRESFDLENNLGVELFRTGKYEEAQARFEASTKLAPNWWTNWNNLGVIYERGGDYEKAEQFYQKAIDNGRYYLAYENLARLLFLHQDPQKAYEFTQQALKRLPRNTTLKLIESKLKNP